MIPTRTGKCPASEVQRAVSQRLREERETERFTQYELADEIGVTRATLASFEQGHNPVSFAVGFEVCRRLDLSPRWLATGEGPKRPFPPLAELGITPADLRKYARRGVNFISGYEKLLALPIAAWLEKNPPEKLIARQFRGGVEPLARRLSAAELVSDLRDRIAIMRKETSEEARCAHADVADSMLSEVAARLEVVGRKKRR